MNTEKKKIVIVEDDEILLKLLTEKLENTGYEVKSSVDGEKGLALIRSEQPDLVLLDIILPSKDGFQILEELNTEGVLPDLPVIVISNSGQPVEIDRILKLGVRDYLVKLNFSPYSVMEKVKKVFEEEMVK